MISADFIWSARKFGAWKVISQFSDVNYLRPDDMSSVSFICCNHYLHFSNVIDKFCDPCYRNFH